jgi:hypothetical protein
VPGAQERFLWAFSRNVTPNSRRLPRSLASRASSLPHTKAGACRRHSVAPRSAQCRSGRSRCHPYGRSCGRGPGPCRRSGDWPCSPLGQAASDRGSIVCIRACSERPHLSASQARSRDNERRAILPILPTIALFDICLSRDALISSEVEISGYRKVVGDRRRSPRFRPTPQIWPPFPA